MWQLFRKYFFLIWRVAAVAAIVAFVSWSIVPLQRPVKPLASTKVLARDGSLLYDVAPSEEGVRTPVPLSAVPKSLINAVVANEDARFHSHHGVDFRATLRAAKDHFFGTGVPSGASTIEQQLIKITYFPTAPRSILEKLREIFAAEYWASTHSKDETLEQYLNTIYFGNATYGIQAASQVYFHTSVQDLNTAESAMLVGIITSPSAFDPYRHWSVARERQSLVLQRMVDEGSLTSAERDAAYAIDLPIFSPRHQIKAPLFVLRVLDNLEATYPDINNGGYIVKTTLDPELQRVAEEAVTRRLATVSAQHVTDAATVAMNPQNGEVLAYVGSADYFDETIQGQVDMAAAKRQPGSALKPFMYLAAFMRGVTPGTVIADLPVRFETADGQGYYPRNYNLKYNGPVTVRDALGSSLNIPAVKVLNQIGLGTFFGTLTQFGLTFPETPDHYGLGVVLGGGEVSLTEATRAYAELALSAKSVPIRFVSEIDDSSGRVIERAASAPSKPLFQDAQKAAQASALVTDILSDERARTLSFGATSLMELHKGIAVKTGTTKDFRDNWTFGYSPEFVLGVWVGNADNTPMKGVSGITGAVPIWHDIMQDRFAHEDPIQWPTPSGLIQREICVTSGMLANGICPKTRNEWFIQGTEPATPDDWYHVCGGKTYLIPPAEYAAWLVSSGYARPSASTCPDLAGIGTTGASQILSPLDGDSFDRSDFIADSAQQIPFLAGGGPGPYQWTLDGRTFTSVSAQFLWNPTPGTHVLELAGSGRQVHFFVR